MQVDVIHGLTSLGITIHDHAVTALCNTCVRRNLLSCKVTLADEVNIIGIQVIGGRDMGFRNHQYVRRGLVFTRLRANIVPILVYNIRLDFAGHHLAE